MLCVNYEPMLSSTWIERNNIKIENTCNSSPIQKLFMTKVTKMKLY